MATSKFYLRSEVCTRNTANRFQIRYIPCTSSFERVYFFHKKYLYELMRVDPESPSYEDLIKRYKMHTNTWKKHNLLLSNRFSLSPSAKEIAENVGMKPRTVWFYLNHAKKRKDLFPFLKQE